MGYGPWGHKESVTTEVTERACMKQKGLPQVVLVVKNLPTNAGDIRDVGSIPGLGRSPGGGPAIHSCIPAWRTHGQRSLAGYGA